jgi:hypothetical protein
MSINVSDFRSKIRKKKFNFSDFEQEAGYPKQDTRFLDLSIRGLCTDEKGKVHDIHKELIIGKFGFDFDLIRLGFLFCFSRF